MKRSEFIKLIQDVGRSYEDLLNIYAVQSVRCPNNKQCRIDAESYAEKDRTARETADKIIGLVHGHLPTEWKVPEQWEHEKV